MRKGGIPACGCVAAEQGPDTGSVGGLALDKDLRLGGVPLGCAGPLLGRLLQLHALQQGLLACLVLCTQPQGQCLTLDEGSDSDVEWTRTPLDLSFARQASRKLRQGGQSMTGGHVGCSKCDRPTCRTELAVWLCFGICGLCCSPCCGIGCERTLSPAWDLSEPP